jgi:hypothetical protein
MRSNSSWSLAPLVMAGLAAVALPQAQSMAADVESHDHTHYDASTMGSAPSSDQEPAMRHMRQMHEKMMAAKTPAERQALMAEHMQAMRAGMESMKHMTAAGKCGKAMPENMAMMTLMMQMMGDREDMAKMPMTLAPDAPKTK